MALHGRVPGLGDTHVVPGGDLARLGLSSAAKLYRSRRLFSEPGVRAAFVRGSCPLSASAARAQVYFGTCEPPGLWRISVPGAFFAACFRILAIVGRALHWIQYGIAQRGRLPRHLADLSNRSRRYSKFRF